MKFLITKKVILAKCEEKGKVNLYTLLDMEDFSKIVAIGVKTDAEFEERSLVEVTINIRIQSERLELKNGEKRFVENASIFVSSITSMEVSQ